MIENLFRGKLMDESLSAVDAKVVPRDETARENGREAARDGLLRRLVTQPAMNLPRASRDELCDR